MNANEIVKALHVCGHDGDCHECPAFSVGAFEIEDFTKCHEVMQGATTLIESLQAQLAASQRRERAAVEDLNHIANAIANSKQLLDGGEETVACLKLGRCDVCKEACDGSGCRFKWRGPQEAGEVKHG